MDFTELYETAVGMRFFAYTPYYDFRVGAALLAENESGEKRVFTGCNVQNSAFGANICAEHTAGAKAVSEGYRVFRAVAVAGGMGDTISEMVLPCGVCRQFLSEFAAEGMKVILLKDGSPAVFTLDEIFPRPFAL